MPPGPHPPGSLLDTREQTIERLSEAFARNELDLEQYEHRIDLAFACRTHEELVRVLRDLAPAEAMVPSSVPGTAIVAAAPAARRPRLALAVFGNVERGLSALPSSSKAIAVFGNVELDLRRAVLERGLTELRVHAVFGNVQLTVPPNLAVQCEGIGVFGNFESMARLPVDPTAEPVLRITGTAVFGNVELRTRPRRK
ncbi:MAG: DUF1707 and DUF2154 domain-containing protein [Polyangiaceae bacterium]|nr:DUF1707 and DUF2154 domain-containing protein [Polyangiaceae bacterium]